MNVGEPAADGNSEHRTVDNPVATALFSLYPTGWLRLSQTRANRYFDEMLARVSQDPPRIFPIAPCRACRADGK